MRIGFNPNKDKPQEPNDFYHQVIIPVYIPNNEGYFRDSFQILKYCLESLFKTAHQKTYIAVVNNGSCIEVVNYLDDLYRQGKIQELIHTSAIGKLNAILKALAGHNFDLVTISDADVLFLNDWQKETYTIFEAFPKAGAICPAPSSKVLKQNTYNVLFENFFSKKTEFTPVKNPVAMINFAESIGNLKFYQECHLAYNLTVSNKNTKAVVGAGHFVASYKGLIFNDLKDRYSDFWLGGDSEEKFLDRPVADQGYWRLSTEDNFAYHMGNVREPWMQEKLNDIEDTSELAIPIPVLKKVSASAFSNFIREKVFMKILTRRRIWIWFLQYKGLDKESSKKY